MNRDDFGPRVQEAVRRRSAYICSNPDCRCMTVAPAKLDPEKSVYVGIVAHITAAAPGGPRYDPGLTAEERASAQNGIYLCARCATMIDKNQGIDYPVDLLKQWKNDHEEWVAENLNKTPWSSTFEDEVKFQFVRQAASRANEFRARFLAATDFRTFASEYEDREKDSNESREESELLNEFYARKRRLADLQEVLKGLHEDSWEAEAILGRDISELIQPLDRVYGELLGTVQAYFAAELERVRRGGWGNPKNDVWLDSFHKKIYGIDDSLAQSVIGSVDKLVAELTSYVR